MHKTDKTIDQVIDIAERPGLGAVTINRQGVILQGLQDKIGDYSAVKGMHVGAIGIKYSGHLNAQLVLPEIIKEKCFGAALSLIITGARPYGIY